MDNLIFSLNATMPVFLVMMAGYFFKRIGWLSESFAAELNTFVFKIALPVSLFSQLYDVDFFTIWDTQYVLYCIIATLLSIAIAFAVARFSADEEDRPEFIQASYRSSSSLLGMAYIELLYGEASVGALMMLGSVPLYNICAVIILSNKAGSKINIRKTLIGVVTNPIILGIAFGFAWSLLRLGMPQMFSTTISYIGRLASPLGLLSMGAALHFGEMFGKLRPSLIASFLKLIGLPALFIPFAILLGFTGEKLVAVLIMLASASTVAGYIMARNMGHKGIVASSVVMITTLFSFVTLTAWLYILRSMALI